MMNECLSGISSRQHKIKGNFAIFIFQSRNRQSGLTFIMELYTEKDLVNFGNSLFRRYDIRIHSTDGKNTPLEHRDVSHADIELWKVLYEKDNMVLPSAHQPEEIIVVRFKEGTQFPGEILAVHFYAGKVKYDIEINIGGDLTTRLYNIESAFVEKA